jgi:hypothetical protein
MPCSLSGNTSCQRGCCEQIGLSSSFVLLAPHPARSRNPSNSRNSSVTVLDVGSSWNGFKYAATVPNGTETSAYGSHNGNTLRKNKQKRLERATNASVKKEMALPRMAKSARIAELKLGTARIPERPSASMPGTVDKTIPSPRPSKPEKAQIAVEAPDHRYRDLRIENALIDEHGDDVKLKKVAHVEITVTTKDVDRHK